MKVLTAKLYIFIGISIFAFTACVIVLTDYIARYAFVAMTICFGIPLTITGLMELKRSPFDPLNEQKKEREAAMILSLLPGLGHFYMERYRRGCWFLTLFLFSVVTTCLGIVSMETQKSIELAVLLISYGMTLLFFAVFWSALEVNEICNKEGLPHNGGTFEMKWDKTAIGENILFISTYLMLTLLSFLFIYFDYLKEIYIPWAVLIASTVIPVHVARRIFRPLESKIPKETK